MTAYLESFLKTLFKMIEVSRSHLELSQVKVTYVADCSNWKTAIFTLWPLALPGKKKKK